MSNPNIQNITPTISLSIGQTVPLLLASIALEELALAHMVNAEAEKLQLVLGTLTPTSITFSPAVVSVSNLLAVNASVQQTLRDVIKKEMLLEFKFENILDLIALTPGAISPTPPCSCQVTNTSGMAFDITRGSGAVTATLNTVPITGGAEYNGLFCSGCSPTSNFFTFTFSPPGGPSLTSIFNATSFTVPHCPGNATVTVTGQGTLTGGTLAPTLGPNPTYTLTITKPNFISITLTGNGSTFTATVNNVGVGEVVLSDCP